MGIGESVKKGFGVATQSLDLVLALFAFGAVWNLINLAITPQIAATPEAAPEVGASAMMIFVGVVFILVSFFVQAGSLGYIAEKVKTGKSQLATFFGAGAKYYLRLLLLGLMIALIVGGLLLLIGILVALLAGRLDVLGIIISLLIGAGIIYFVLLVFLAPYAIVVSNLGVIASIKNSMELVKKNILAVLGIAVILVAIGFVFGILLGILFALLSAAMAGAAGVSQFIFALLSSFVNAFLGVLVTGSFMSFYLGISGTANTSGAE